MNTLEALREIITGQLSWPMFIAICIVVTISYRAGFTAGKRRYKVPIDQFARFRANPRESAPLGVLAAHLWRLERIRNIEEAIARRRNGGWAVAQVWIDELEEHGQWMRKHRLHVKGVLASLRSRAQPMIVIASLMLTPIAKADFAFLYERKGVVAESVTLDEMRITIPGVNTDIRFHRVAGQTLLEFEAETVKLVNAIAKQRKQLQRP